MDWAEGFFLQGNSRPPPRALHSRPLRHRPRRTGLHDAAAAKDTGTMDDMMLVAIRKPRTFIQTIGIIAAASVVMIIVALGTCREASATLIEWTLNDFVFDDGGTATGLFEWNTSTDQIGAFEILVSGGDTSKFPELI